MANGEAIELFDLEGKDGNKYTVTVTRAKDGIVCQPWSFTGPAFKAKDLEKAAKMLPLKEDD